MSDRHAASRVAEHYSSRANQGREAREYSRIYNMRKLNNWVKSVLILAHTQGGEHVLDLACGKGGDLPKWSKAGIGFWAAVDIAPDSVVEHARMRYNTGNYTFPAQLLCADAFSIDLMPYLKPVKMFDLISCQMAFHYSFSTRERAEQCLRNVRDLLRPGGYFIGTTTDANVLVKRLRNSADMSFGNDVYRVEFNPKHASKEFPPDQPFGIEYTFSLEDAVDTLPEYLVPFPVLKRMAEEHGLELVLKANFHDFIKAKMTEDTPAELMQSLQVLPLDGSELSDDEWEATYLYCVFAFKKKGDATSIASALMKRAQEAPLGPKVAVKKEDVVIVASDQPLDATQHKRKRDPDAEEEEDSE